MRLGIKKMEWIDSNSLHDFSTLPPGSTLNISTYIKTGGTFTELPFTPETADYAEQWTDDESGRKSKASFRASVRRDKDAFKEVLQALLGRKAVWRITLISGVIYIIGSKEYVPSFTFSEGISGISSSELNISIDNESTHGVFIQGQD